MKKVILVGNIENNTEIKLSQNDLEILEFTIDEVKVKAFGKVAKTAKSLSGLVIADGTIQIRDYTTKDGRNITLQEIIINHIEGTSGEPKDNFDVKPSDFAPGKTTIEPAKDMEFDDEQLPFY